MVMEAKPKGRGSQIPVLTRIKVRNLYLSQSLTHREIAVQVGLEERAVGKLISADGLPALKAKRTAKLVNSSDARTEKQLTEVEHTLADEAEEIALAGLGKARDAVQRSDRDAARDFQAYTGGVKNLVGVAKLIRSIDGVNTQEHGIGVSVFMLRCGDAKTERNVTPSVYDGI